jgi:hypothetical protein
MEITKCTGGDCPLKPACHRYTTPDANLQSYIYPPFTFEDGEVFCKMYWGDEQQKLKDFLMSITLGEEK